MNRLEGKVAIITGAVQGIGRACAVRVAQEGAAVVLGDLQDDDATVNEITAAGGHCARIVMDVRKRADWQRLVSAALDSYGRVDLLGNVAGVVNMHSPDNVVELTDEGWDTVLDTDLRGVWLGMQAAIPKMVQGGGGRIVNISSLAALKGLDNLAAYSAAKAGVIGLTQQTALEFAKDNILVNAIAPGTIDTPILADITPEMKKMNENSHMIKRLGRPSEIAGMMAFLFSGDGDFSTGLTFPVDGGWSVNGRNF
ncbi:MAG TPA: SDR family NAD(P)-dependent oxidoreductase [Solirubrobacteraceae bacterium]|jgi:NAD(P)-dependent dehydrogenase (short-subunit alcohol dehydrogenase family)|nr:SDR family NAD(P)-dependent oxidoreductase [Solirubrobacteraceae bacterium]